MNNEIRRIPKTLISTRRLAINVGGHRLLNDINLEIRRGDIVALLGPNGSGKTTLLRALIGAIQPSEGSVILDSNLTIGYVPQRLHVDETLPMTVNRFLQLPVRRHRNDLTGALERAGVPRVGKQQLRSLSGGSSSGCCWPGHFWRSPTCYCWTRHPRARSCWHPGFLPTD